MQRLHIGIAGAGLLGRLAAWQLAGLGHRVTVFDPAPDASARGAAGWTAAGMLSPLAELDGGDTALAELGLRSLRLWPGIVEALPRPVHFRREGSLLLAHGPDLGMAQRLLARIGPKTPPGLAPEPLPRERLRVLEPLVSAAHAWLLPGEGQIHSVQAMQALAEGAAQRGVSWRWGRRTEQVAPGRIDADFFDLVLDLRGVGARPDVAVRGVRGEILWLHAPGVALQRPLRLLHPRAPVYIVPRPNDIVVVGASEIESEDRSPISVQTLLALLSAAHSVLPELAEARLVHSETNLRPALPDNLPLLDVQPGLLRINGLFRHGWMVAPALLEQGLQRAGITHTQAAEATA